MQSVFARQPLAAVALLPGRFRQGFDLNRSYVLSLTNHNLLQNYYLEAGLWSAQFRNTTHGHSHAGDDRHWGWESPTSQVRGHFLGHWLSAAARIHAATPDAEVKVRADQVVAELARCQEKNGGGWAGPFPEKYLHWTAAGQPTWAPQYVIHKTLMGLVDMHVHTGSGQALDILRKWAGWFHRWTQPFSREQMDNLLDVETGGMLEVWADLYGITGDADHLDLLRRYDRPRLFERLLRGEDVLSNMHANTTIPEAHGAARAYEVTGDERWRRIVEAYWRCAVTDRGGYCTGGQTNGEVWTAPFALSARLGDRTQEHCTVYNLIRLADYLLRWTGKSEYADYIERNLHNGILAQQHPQTGLVAYFLPLRAGSRKVWGSATNDFWCCHGSLVQAHTLPGSLIYFADGEGPVVSQYIPSEWKTGWRGTEVKITQQFNARNGRLPDGGDTRRPVAWSLDFTVGAARPTEFVLKLRRPSWLAGPAKLTLNGAVLNVKPTGGYWHIHRTWHEDKLQVELPKALWTCPLPDEPGTMAFMDGPVVLAGLCADARCLHGDASQPASILMPDNEREFGFWQPGYRTRNEVSGVRFVPLHEVTTDPYTVYFPIKPAQHTPRARTTAPRAPVVRKTVKRQGPG